MTSSSNRLIFCAAGVIGLAAGLFCTLAPPSQLATASRILFILAAVGAVVAALVIGLMFRSIRRGWDDGNGGDQSDGSEPLDPADNFDRELRELLKQEGALQ